ncbi:Pentatricopeptide repeat-containing protein [Arachis hypogaea]|uniref:Pentatricopeptide repeat-containing protein n=1 Tax=Arachis hypogaea TaxID=3818 RepID=A0A6B9V8R3_ARAHY|nr:Pentatricopeptide repeat-containing protein [Arachis hypogaea]
MAKVVHAHYISSYGFLACATIDLYATASNAPVAQRLFHQLHPRQSHLSTYNSIISMYSRQGNVEFGTLFHSCMIKASFMSNPFCQGAFIDLYAKYSFLCHASAIFDTAVLLDTVSWMASISGYVRAGLPQDTLQVFDKMQIACCFPDQVIFVTVLNALVNLVKLDIACKLFRDMHTRNVVAWNAMISGYDKRSHHKEAIVFFLEIRKCENGGKRSKKHKTSSKEEKKKFWACHLVPGRGTPSIGVVRQANETEKYCLTQHNGRATWSSRRATWSLGSQDLKEGVPLGVLGMTHQA